MIREMIELLETSPASKIIGKTKSGKPIYQSFMQQQEIGGSIAGWSVVDFWDAEEAHSDAYAVASGKHMSQVSYDQNLYTPEKERAAAHKASAASFSRMASRVTGAADKLGLAKKK